MQRGLTGKRIALSGRGGEKGQTILLIAISIVALLAMAALAIDVVSLYVAKSEIQRAADAVALAGAKAIADSGVTTLPPGDTTNLPPAETLAQSMANAAITALLSASPGNANLVSGQTPTLVGTPTFDFTTHGNSNPTITVTLQQTNLPTFFARIFARMSAIAQATATAEAYNPNNMQTEQGSFTPIAPRCVKPWLMANGDPTAPTAQNNGDTLPPLIDEASGLVVQSNLANFIGNSFYLTANCNPPGNPACTGLYASPENKQGGIAGQSPPYQAAYYMPATVAPTNLYAPTCANTLSPYAQVVAGCDSTPYSWTQCGGTTTNLLWDPTKNPAQGSKGSGGSDANADTALGAECLLGLPSPGGTGAGQGQDEISYPSPGWPTNPPQITVRSGAQAGNVVTTSNSIVTIPIIGNQPLSSTNRSVTVVGFLQAFINFIGYDTGSGSANQDYADINITVMNVVGCGQTANGNPAVVGGNGASAIPVRLITPP